MVRCQRHRCRTISPTISSGCRRRATREQYRRWSWRRPDPLCRWQRRRLEKQKSADDAQGCAVFNVILGEAERCDDGVDALVDQSFDDLLTVRERPNFRIGNQVSDDVGISVDDKVTAKIIFKGSALSHADCLARCVGGPFYYLVILADNQRCRIEAVDGRKYQGLLAVSVGVIDATAKSHWPRQSPASTLSQPGLTKRTGSPSR